MARLPPFPSPPRQATALCPLLLLSAAFACNGDPGAEGVNSRLTGGTGSGAAPTTASGGGPDGGSNASGGASVGLSSAGGSTGGSTPASSGGAGSGGTGSGGTVTSPEDSAIALEALRDWLALAPSARPSLDGEAFSQTALSRPDLDTARDLLWEDLAAQIRLARQTEADAKSITWGGSTLNYETVLLGDEPADGRSLFISMHGGGNAPKGTNDEQWQNQIALASSYAPEDTLWVAPRAPIDDWNMWFTSDIPPLFDRLISNMIVFEGVNPNKIYLTGYSAGGDGVYQLGPTMADRWAGAAMSAGHPNDMTPTNLRNLAFAIHVGGDDTAYDRNLVAADWGQQLDVLQTADPTGYPHQVEVHAGLPHWMNLADQPSVPFIQSFTRDVYVDRIVWRQSTLLETRFYWLKVDEEQAVKDAQITASIEGQVVTLTGNDLTSVSVLLADELLDLDQDVTIVWDGAPVFEGPVSRTILALYRSLSEREDPAASFSAELVVVP